MLFVASSVVMMVLAAGALSWGMYQWRQLMSEQQRAAAAREQSATKRTAMQPKSDDQPANSGDSEVGAAQVTAPPLTRVARRGAVEVVDLGRDAEPLDKVLVQQHAIAAAGGRRLLVMTTAAQCGPCRALDRELDDLALQRALSRVRLLRLDLNVFHEELALAGFRTSAYPAFFLVDAQGHPFDGIHGGEWDADIAENMAPVLGAFAAGSYRERRHDWSPTPDSLEL